MLDLPDDEVHVWLVRGGGDELRSVLGRYVDDLRFDTAPLGKPFLVGRAVRFNLSHSGDLAAVAVARRREVGVDVERLRPVHREARVARRIMSDAEHAQYLALPEAERGGFLLRTWARKEALVKAAGTGIRSSLQAVSADDRFTVVDLDVPGYAAAVAAEGQGWQPVVRHVGPGG